MTDPTTPDSATNPASSGDDTPAYDEFGLFHENIAEFDLDVAELPPVERVEVEVESAGESDDGTGAARTISALRWGTGEPELVLLHGGAQNAHTWDTVALALGRPLVAIDLPGHGHSGWRADGAYNPNNLADDVAVAIRALAPRAEVVVGMSLGGMTTMALATRHPDLVRSLVMVDITPGVNADKTKAITDFVDGPQSFDSFDDLLARTMQFNPTRSESSLRRGILHNAAPVGDGSWAWRYDRGSRARAQQGTETPADVSDAPAVEPALDVDAIGAVMNPLWEDFASITSPMMLVRGSLSPVVDDDDVAEAQRRQPGIEVHVVDGAGHSVQGDRPVELAELLEAWLTR
jgi:pimeloyl-ACP methyl ester carboxylesterase